MGERLATAGFAFPEIYTHSKERVLKCLEQGRLDLLEVSRWQLVDEFFAFILQSKFLEHADSTYPNPRKKNEIPVWFQISCLLLLRTVGETSYKNLHSLLRAGPVLNRVGFNVLAEIGFNDKNKYPRTTPVHQDAVRKFFKDTDPVAMRRWFYRDLQRWFKRQGLFDPNGIYIIDQTHVVVPDNENYQDAVRMPVDAHGQRYPNYDELSDEQRRALPHHPCYTLSTLLHLNFEKETAHFAGYEWGPGNIDELPQAHQLVDRFFLDSEKGTMKLLIMDRGYVSGQFISYVKSAYGVDVLIPLKKNMDQMQDAIAIANMSGTQWTTINPKGSFLTDPSRSIRACTISDVALWDECKVPLYTTVFEDSSEHPDDSGSVVRHFVLACTKKFDSPHQVINSYSFRGRTEECFRQLKHSWNIMDFPSPDRSLIEAHVAFTLIAFCLFQYFLFHMQYHRSLKRMISSLRREHTDLENALIAYAGGYFGIFGCLEFFSVITQLPKETQLKIKDKLPDLPNQF